MQQYIYLQSCHFQRYQELTDPYSCRVKVTRTAKLLSVQTALPIVLTTTAVATLSRCEGEPPPTLRRWGALLKMPGADARAPARCPRMIDCSSVCEGFPYKCIDGKCICGKEVIPRSPASIQL
ncbi:hypothetical protein D5086_020095 [Populus alba]|uniref:Uncharacterized protein n=1 Tax=Populus alba TaxID=43335 RepID=A0ACC4BJQ9_POPAL